MKNKKTTKEKGVSLYLAIVILSVLTAVLLALVSISVSQIKVIWTLSDSIKAFYAADTGIEQALYQVRKEGNYNNFLGKNGDSSYQVFITSDANGVSIKSIGNYNGTKRAIETNY